MAVAKVLSGAPIGFDSHTIEVESDATKGLPSIQIVGLAHKSIDEAKERIKSAIANSLLEYPTKHITINLAPAELPKEGTHYDLPIALAVLISSGQLRQSEVENALFAGELALDGSIRPIKGAITLAEATKHAGLTKLYLPATNAAQASLIDGIEVIGVKSLKDLFLHLKQEAIIHPVERAKTAVYSDNYQTPKGPRLDDIYGQEQAKRALIIAAAGRHNLLLSGSPGAGKTMLAKTLISILPGLTPEECIATTKLHSLAGHVVDSIVNTRPFRSPHHTSSRIALIGGGTRPLPGEISLAHCGVLFLDEIPEYPRSTLEALRQPLEDKTVALSRASGHVSYPADFMLIATMNPCPCGYYGDNARECTCTSTQILAYQKRLSGPLLDRIDLTVTVSRVPNDTLLASHKKSHLQHKSAKNIIDLATKRQHNRYKKSDKYNATITSTELKAYTPLSDTARQLLNTATERLQLSARSYFKVIKVARTIADLDDSDAITDIHISEALQYRQST